MEDALEALPSKGHKALRAVGYIETAQAITHIVCALD